MNKKIVKYTICSATTHGTMIDRVNDLIQDGWHLYGELQVNNGCLYQTMVQYERIGCYSTGPR